MTGMKQDIDWNSWLGQNSARLMLYARQQCRREADAEDVLQEALVALVRSVESGEFLGEPEQWLSYVYTAIRHRSMDKGRREDVRSGYIERMQDEEPDLGLCNPWLCSADEDAIARDAVEEMLKEINPDYAEVIVLRIWGGRALTEISDILGLPTSTINSRYRYGIQALRRGFEERGIVCKLTLTNPL